MSFVRQNIKALRNNFQNLHRGFLKCCEITWLTFAMAITMKNTFENNRTYITAFAPIPWQWQVAKQSFFHCHWNETMVIYTAGSSTFVYDCCKVIEITVVTNLCSTFNLNVCSYQFIKLSSLSWCLLSHPVFFHTVMVSPPFSVDIDNCFNRHKNEYGMLLKHSWNEWQWRLLCTDIIITARKWSCGKVMFYTCLSVNLFTSGCGGESPLQRTPPTWTETPRRVKSGQYASYWSAFLFGELQ